VREQTRSRICARFQPRRDCERYHFFATSYYLYLLIPLAQRILLSLTEDDASIVASTLVVANQLVEQSDLGEVKPSLIGSKCTASVDTYSHLDFERDPVDFGHLQSASTIKAKMKLEDLVTEAVCLPERVRAQCADINQAALEKALNAAEASAFNRYISKGRQLVIVDDKIVTAGPQWEFSGGLSYTTVGKS